MADMNTEPVTHQCERCGEPIPTTKRADARYCSERCRAAETQRRVRDRNGVNAPRPCEVCGARFVQTGSGGRQRFCSPACVMQAKTDKRAAAKARRPPCPACGAALPASVRLGSRFCSAACRQRADAKSARGRGGNLKYLYGLTLDEFERLFAAQDGRCAICRTDAPGGKGGTLHVDHSHATGAVRALLCTRCNNGLGSLQDDPALLRAAADYLERHAMT